MLEGASSFVHADGTQNWRYWLRSDCMGEASMAMALGGVLCQRGADKAVAAKLNDFIYFTSDLCRGPRADPASPSYGLIRWHLDDANGGIYYGDDNARCMLGTMATAAVLNEARWDEPLRPYRSRRARRSMASATAARRRGTASGSGRSAVE